MIAAVSRPLGALLLAVGTLAALLVGATPAAAHATLTGSSPGDGEVVATAPTEVALSFSEPVSVADEGLRVLDPDGQRADTGELAQRSGGAEQAVAVEPGLGDGTYTVAWQAVSNDGHPIAGAFTFSVGAPSETSVSVSGDSPDDGAVGLLYDALRYAAYAGFLLLVGPAVFALACWPGAAGRRGVQRVTLAGWLTLAVATAALLLVRVPYTTTGRLADALDLAGLGDVVDSRAGTALLTRLVLLSAAALPVALLHGRYARAVAAGDATAARDLRFGLGVGGGALAVGLAATWAMAEHAATGRQSGVAVPVDIVHLLAMACWLGGLVTLVALLRDDEGRPPPAGAVRRFSALALGSVATLAATGLYQSWRQVGTFSALTGTDYGRLLIAKVAVVALLLAVAWTSRRWTRGLPPDAGGEPVAPGRRAAPAEAMAGGRRTPPTGDNDAMPAAPAVEGAEAAPAAAADRPEAGGDGDGDGDGADRPLAGGRRAPGGRPAAHDGPPLPGAPTPSASGPAPDGDDGGTRAAGGENAAGERQLAASGARTPSERERARQLARQRRAVARARRRREEGPARAGLRRSVLVETAVAVVLLGVTTALTGTPPARTESDPPPAAAPAPEEEVGVVPPITLPYDTGGAFGSGQATVELTPSAVGDNTLHVYLEDPDGEANGAEEIRVSLTLPAEGIGPLRLEPEHVAVGHWTVTGVQLPRPGEWDLDLTIRTSDIDQTTETTTVTVS